MYWLPLWSSLSEIYLRCYLPGCSPYFAPNKIELAVITLCIFLVDITIGGGWNWGWAHHLGTENRKHLQDCAVDEPEDTGEMHLEMFRGVAGFSVCRHRSGVDDFVLIWPKPREGCMSTEDCLSPAVGCGSVPGCMHANSLRSCPTLCHPMDCSLLGSSIHGISQARILERVSISSSRGSSQTHVSWGSCLDRQIFYHWATLGSPYITPLAKASRMAQKDASGWGGIATLKKEHQQGCRSSNKKGGVFLFSVCLATALVTLISCESTFSPNLPCQLQSNNSSDCLGETYYGVCHISKVTSPKLNLPSFPAVVLPDSLSPSGSLHPVSHPA